MKNVKKIATLMATLTLVAGCSTARSSEQTNLVAPESDVELYYAARSVSTNMAAYDEETCDAMQDILIHSFDISATVNENVDIIENPDEATQANLDSLRTAYNSIVQIASVDDVVYDIYEGKELPVMGNVSDNESREIASLTDTEDFRPVLNSYMLDDPSSAIGTIIAVPSIRGSYSETRDYADIFNEKGYNVLTLEPRFNHVDEDNRTYYLMNLDCIRAVRYVKYHADDLGVDPDKLVVVAGSKGNYAHVMTTEYFDLTPSEYADLMNVPLNGYEEDSIDSINADVAVQIWNYGNLFAVNGADEFTLDDRGIYTQEYFDQGITLPAMIFLGGNYDTMVTPMMSDVITALVKFNANEDKLYELNWEVHEFNAVPHGSGAGTQYANVVAYWDQADAFIQSVFAQGDNK